MKAGQEREAGSKTNVLRILDQAGIAYRHYLYDVKDVVPSGCEVAALLGVDPGCVFKTLVTVGRSGEHYVFVIPVERELNLKKAAKAVGEKSVEMIRSKELLPLTGYIHGGCSPIGMKKPFRTWLDSHVQNVEHMLMSAGRIGHQVELAPADLIRLIGCGTADLTDEISEV